MRNTIFPAALLLALLTAVWPASADDVIDPQHTWDLTDLYPTTADWDRAREEVLAELESIEARKGTLGDSADSLYQAYRQVSDTLRKAGRVFVYASLNADEDLQVSQRYELRDEDARADMMDEVCLHPR